MVSAVACVLGRFCSKKSDKSSKSHHPNKPHKGSKKGKHDHNVNHNHMMNHHKGGGKPHHGGGGGRPKDRDLEFGYRSKEGDIMMGFDTKMKSMPSSAKVANNNGDFRVDSMGRGNNMMGSHYQQGNNPRDFRVDSMGRGMENHHHHGNPRDFP